MHKHVGFQLWDQNPFAHTTNLDPPPSAGSVRKKMCRPLGNGGSSAARMVSSSSNQWKDKLRPSPRKRMSKSHDASCTMEGPLSAIAMARDACVDKHSMIAVRCGLNSCNGPPPHTSTYHRHVTVHNHSPPVSGFRIHATTPPYNVRHTTYQTGASRDGAESVIATVHPHTAAAGTQLTSKCSSSCSRNWPSAGSTAGARRTMRCASARLQPSTRPRAVAQSLKGRRSTCAYCGRHGPAAAC